MKLKFFIVLSLFSVSVFALDPGLKTVRENYFNKSRDLQDYDSLCDYELKPLLKMLAKESLAQGRALRVLDSGCGDGFALLEAEKNYKSLSFTGLTYRMETFMRLEISRLVNVDLIVGNFIEDLSIAEILGQKPKFSLILDIFGPYSYSPKIIDVINKYLSMLEPEGEIFIVSLACDRRFNRERGLAVIFEDNRFIDISRWLLINGLNLEIFKNKDLEFIRIKAKGAKALEPLVLDHTYPFLYPPTRDFKLRAAKL